MRRLYTAGLRQGGSASYLSSCLTCLNTRTLIWFYSPNCEADLLVTCTMTRGIQNCSSRNPVNKQKRSAGQNWAKKLYPGHTEGQNGFHIMVRRANSRRCSGLKGIVVVYLLVQETKVLASIFFITSLILYLKYILLLQSHLLTGPLHHF
jgi:hypothetical protein